MHGLSRESCTLVAQLLNVFYISLLLIICHYSIENADCCKFQRKLLGSSRLNFLSRESLTASKKIGEREIEGESERGGESRVRRQEVTWLSEDHPPRARALAHNLRRNWRAVYPHTPFPPLPSQACHFDVLSPSAMNLHNGHAHEVLGGRVLKRRTA